MTPILVNKRVRRGMAALAAAGLMIGLAGCAPGKPDLVPSDDDATPAVTVTVKDNTFEPAAVDIAPGQAVRWEFEGSADHDVVADDGSFVSELLREGSYTHVFEEAGEYGYDCSIHPEMTGVVTVK